MNHKSMNKLRSKFSDVPFLKTSFTIYKRQETVIVSSILATRTVDVSEQSLYMMITCSFMLPVYRNHDNDNEDT